MEHLDEEIIKLINEQEGERPTGRRSIQSGFAQTSNELIRFEEKSLLENKIKICLPASFEVMPEEIAVLKYPSARRPELILTNDDTSINVAFNHTVAPLKEGEMAAFMEIMVEFIQKAHPGATWFEQGVKEIAGQQIGFLDFLSSAMDTKIYNLMFFVSLEGRSLLCTFNCIEKQMKDWQPIAKEMMESLKVSSKQKGGNNG